MNPAVEIDEVDVKILRELIKDARTKLKDIAEICGLSSAAIVTRIKRLRAAGVITGTVLFSNLPRLGYAYPASIELNLDPTEETRIINSIKKQVNVVLLSQSIGHDDLSLFVVAKSPGEIDNVKQEMRNRRGISKISVSLWGTPQFSLENINLEPTTG